MLNRLIASALESVRLKRGWTAEQLEEYVQQCEEERTRKKAEVAERYKVDASKFPRLIENLQNAEDTNRHCENCTGDCPKSRDKYWQQVITLNDNAFSGFAFPYQKCIFGRMQDADVSLPLEYRAKTFSDYEVHEQNEQTVEWAKKMPFDKSLNLYVHGVCGSGKTFLAALVMKSAVMAGRSVQFGTFNRLFATIKATFDDKDKSTQEAYDRLYKWDLLILDDLGGEKFSDWAVKELFELINERYNSHRQILITSNLTPEELRRSIGRVDEVQAAKIYSRICGMCEVSCAGNVDYRIKKRRERNAVN